MLAFIKAVSPLVVVLLVYAIWIRPKIRTLAHIKDFYDAEEGLWQRILMWVRVQWDAIVAVGLIMWPQLPDLLQQITGLDLSGLVPSDWTKLINQLIGVALVVLRAINLAATSIKKDV